MAMESFPRLREKNFNYGAIVNVPPRRSGRIDRIIGDLYGTPMMYKAIAAYSMVVNPTAARPGIRIDSEALRNELVLRGVPEDEVESRMAEINEHREIGEYDWQDYSDNVNGVISSIEANGKLLVPDMTTMFEWSTRYANLNEEEEED